MTDVEYENLGKGDSVFFVRIIPKLDIYELLDLHIVSIYNEYCTGADSKTKQTFLFSKEDSKKALFLDRKTALEYLNKTIEKTNGGTMND